MGHKETGEMDKEREGDHGSSPARLLFGASVEERD